MAGEGDAGVVDHALLHRRGHHGVELAGEAAADGAVEDIEDVAAVGGIELAGEPGPAKRNMFDSGKTLKQPPIADDDNAGGKGFARDPAAKLRSDASGLARGEGDDRTLYRSSSRSST
jgi:hypothetical protein